MTSNRLYELIDACRPGHDDIDQPEFRELAIALSRDAELKRVFERSQGFDAALQDAFQSVTPPAGLGDRILTALETPSIDDAERNSSVEEVESRVELAKHDTRRSFLFGAKSIGSVVAVLAVVALIAMGFKPSGESSSPSDVAIAEHVASWNAELDNNTPWQKDANALAKEFPTWQSLDLRSAAGWKWVSERRIVCYDFAINRDDATDGKLRLFVFKPTKSVALPSNPPAGYPSSDGWHVGAWQANGRVYYLAVYANRESKSLYEKVMASFSPIGSA